MMKQQGQMQGQSRGDEAVVGICVRGYVRERYFSLLLTSHLHEEVGKLVKLGT